MRAAAVGVTARPAPNSRALCFRNDVYFISHILFGRVATGIDVRDESRVALDSDRSLREPVPLHWERRPAVASEVDQGRPTREMYVTGE